MIKRAVLTIGALALLAACDYNPRPGGFGWMLQKQPLDQEPRYYIPKLSPDGKHGGANPADAGRRIINDSTVGVAPAGSATH